MISFSCENNRCFFLPFPHHLKISYSMSNFQRRNESRPFGGRGWPRRPATSQNYGKAYSDRYQRQQEEQRKEDQRKEEPRSTPEHQKHSEPASRSSSASKPPMRLPIKPPMRQACRYCYSHHPSSESCRARLKPPSIIYPQCLHCQGHHPRGRCPLQTELEFLKTTTYCKDCGFRHFGYCQFAHYCTSCSRYHSPHYNCYARDQDPKEVVLPPGAVIEPCENCNRSHFGHCDNTDNSPSANKPSLQKGARTIPNNTMIWCNTCKLWHQFQMHPPFCTSCRYYHEGLCSPEPPLWPCTACDMCHFKRDACPPKTERCRRCFNFHGYTDCPTPNFTKRRRYVVYGKIANAEDPNKNHPGSPSNPASEDDKVSTFEASPTPSPQSPPDEGIDTVDDLDRDFPEADKVLAELHEENHESAQD